MVAGKSEDILSRYLAFYEALTPESLPQLFELVTEDVYFRDPFNEVRGPAAYQAVLEDMFERCRDPQFKVRRVLSDEEYGIIRWRFSFDSGRWQIDGMSEVQLQNGRVASHIDYWDPCRNLYERLPLLGPLFRLLRGRLSAPQRNS